LCFFRFHVTDRFDLYVQDTFKKLFAERFVPQGFLKEEVVFDGYRVPVNVSVQILTSLSDWHDPSAPSL
jgi:hypothetical protein